MIHTIETRLKLNETQELMIDSCVVLWSRYRRLISPEEANQITFNYNKMLTMLDKAKFNRRITDREIQRIEYYLIRNKRELEIMMRSRY